MISGVVDPTAEAEIVRSHLFIELNEMRAGVLHETSRWNHALEEDTTGTGKWSRPHLPTISIPALVRLRSFFSASNVFLNLEGNDLDVICRTLCTRLQTNGLLTSEEQADRLYSAFSTTQAAREKPAGGGRSGAGAPRPSALSQSVEDEQNDDREEDWFRLLDPEKGEEACDILLTHVDFLSAPLIAFARLTTSIDAGCERHVPVRFIMLIVGPEAEADTSVLMARAFAGTMLDEGFVNRVSQIEESTAFLAALDRHNDNISMLPHVHARPGESGGVEGGGGGKLMRTRG